MNRLPARLLAGVFLSVVCGLPSFQVLAQQILGGETWTQGLRVRTIATAQDRGKWELEVQVFKRASEQPILYRSLETYTDRTREINAVGLDGREYRFTLMVRDSVLQSKLEIRENGEPVDYVRASYEAERRETISPVGAESKALRVGGRVLAPELIRHVPPEYPEEAKQYRVSGIVVVEATIDEEGNVTSTRVVKGLPFGLDEAAEQAVMKWKFRPATLEGRPVKVAHQFTVEFNVHKAD